MAEQDDFDVPALAPGYATPRTPLGDCVNLTVRPGWLRLTGQESMNSLHHVTLVARRQQGARNAGRDPHGLCPRLPGADGRFYLLL